MITKILSNLRAIISKKDTEKILFRVTLTVSKKMMTSLNVRMTTIYIDRIICRKNHFLELKRLPQFK